jgi:hypothetical protein
MVFRGAKWNPESVYFPTLDQIDVRFHWATTMDSSLNPFRVIFSTSLDMHPNGTHILVGQKGGTAYSIRHSENKGTIEKTYTVENAEDSDGSSSALFATKGQAVVFGMTNGSVLVWDRKKGNVVYGLKHPPGIFCISF